MATADVIVLPSGRWLHLQELRQYRTYEGLLEGLPTAERNKQRLERLVSEYRDAPYPGSPYLIRPTEEPVEYRDGRRYPFGTPSALPEVTCIGRFMSHEPARDEASDYSGLVIIWFQKEFAMPIDPSVGEHLRSLDWGRNAADLYY
jgi:hypothetical protein